MSNDDYLDDSGTADNAFDARDDDKPMIGNSPDTYSSMGSSSHQFGEELASDDDMDAKSELSGGAASEIDISDAEVEELPQEGSSVPDQENYQSNQLQEAAEDQIIEVESEPETYGNDSVSLTVEELKEGELDDEDGDGAIKDSQILSTNQAQEVDSEEEIDNLEADDSNQVKNEVYVEEIVTEGSDEEEEEQVVVHVVASQGEQEEASFYEDETFRGFRDDTLQEDEIDSSLKITEQIDDSPDSSALAKQQVEDLIPVKVPIFVCICGDEFLLAPFFEESSYQLQDMISLFSREDVSGKTLEQFFQLLRGNGDLIDAYSFNEEDELRIDIPELATSVTEDNVFTRLLKLDDIINCFYKLRANSEAASDSKVPDKLTIMVSMQPRFISRFKKLENFASSLATFSEVIGTEEQEASHISKKRKLSI